MDRKRLLIAAIVGVGVTSGILWLWLYPRRSDRRQIEELLLRGQQAVEMKRAGTIMSCVSRDYHDSAGNTYIDLYRMAAAACRQLESVQLTVTVRRLDIVHRDATCVAHVQVTLREHGGAATVSAYDTRIELVKERRRWRIIEMENWTPPNLPGQE